MAELGNGLGAALLVAQRKHDDIKAVQMDHASATTGLSMDDIDEFLRLLEKPALAEA